MEKNEIQKKYGGRKWFYLLHHPEIEQMVTEYTNPDTIIDILKNMDYFLEEIHKEKPNFKITSILKLNPKEARTLIWSICQNIMKWDRSHRVARHCKIWVSQFYEYTTDKKITWKRRHKINIVPIRTDRYVPSHKDVFLIVDQCRSIRDKAIALLMYSTGLSFKGIGNLKIRHVKPLLQKYTETKELPLVLKTTSEILPKRFQSNSPIIWLPSLIGKDCADMLKRYYEKHRKDASDDEYFFISGDGNQLIPERMGKQIRNAIRRASSVNPELTKAYPYLLRHSFFNRLVAGNIKDVYRELLMHHSQGIKENYFSSDYHKKKIIEQYSKCNFNREENSEIKLKQLENRQTEFEKAIKEISKLRDEAVKQIPDIVKIRKDDVDRYMELRQMGYVKTMENHAFVVLEKQEST